MLVSDAQRMDNASPTFQRNHHDKSSFHMSPYKDITWFLIIFPILYISRHCFIYLVTESLHLLISLTYFSHPSYSSLLR